VSQFSFPACAGSGLWHGYGKQSVLLNIVRNVQVSDTTGDAMKNQSRVHKNAFNNSSLHEPLALIIKLAH
jgi:hypothetical protein